VFLGGVIEHEALCLDHPHNPDSAQEAWRLPVESATAHMVAGDGEGFDQFRLIDG
jgi:hypothetical protein